MITETQKKQWVEALRSGKYHQCRKKLKNGGKHTSFCCLGVARELFPEDAKSDGSGGLMNDFLEPYMQGRLIDLNDQERESFPKIADFIERNVEAVKDHE